MYREVAKLIIYGNHEDTILMKMSDIFKKFDRDEETPDKLISDIYEQIKSTDGIYGGNIQNDYTVLYCIFLGVVCSGIMIGVFFFRKKKLR